MNKLHLSISDNRINRDGSNLVIGVGDSVERSNDRRKITNTGDEEDDDVNESDNDRELFSGLLGNGDEDAL